MSVACHRQTTILLSQPMAITAGSKDTDYSDVKYGLSSMIWYQIVVAIRLSCYVPEN